jgi:hypothetical protein
MKIIMLETQNGRIKMNQDEIDLFLLYTGSYIIPKFKKQFDEILKYSATSMRKRILENKQRIGDSAHKADCIEIYLRDPHTCNVEKRHREWMEAGCPIGAKAMRAAGLSSPALDFDEEQDKRKQSA